MQRGFTSTVWTTIIIVLLGTGTYFALNWEVAITPRPKPDPKPNPVGRACYGESDLSCGTGYECQSKCGPPVARDADPHPGYSCQVKGYMQPCPICLAKGTPISTPTGLVPVQNVQVGDQVWTVNKLGERVVGRILQVSKTSVPATHKVVHVILSDGREMLVSPGHPIVSVNGRTVRDLRVGDKYNGASVARADFVTYEEEFTYDILSSGETGFYFANYILLDSTLK